MYTQTLVIEGQTSTPLCFFGCQTETDKSPYHNHPTLHRHGYTPIYHLLFHTQRYKNITLGEIGILHNASMQMWRRYFPNATLHGFDNNPAYIEKAVNDQLPNTHYHPIDISDLKSIQAALEPHAPFDILIEDSTHAFADQVNVIRVAHQYLVPQGILVIEDLHRPVPQSRYEDMFQAFGLHPLYENAAFIEANHEFDHTEGFNNSKLLILTKK